MYNTIDIVPRQYELNYAFMNMHVTYFRILHGEFSVYACGDDFYDHDFYERI